MLVTPWHSIYVYLQGNFPPDFIRLSGPISKMSKMWNGESSSFLMS